MLEIAGLTKSYGDRLVVDDVGFHIDLGETYGLLGPNGAGKTTTIRMLCGLLEPDAGTVHVAGHDVAADPISAKRKIGFVPQELALYPDLTARQNLRFFGKLHDLRGSALDKRVEHSLEVVGLADRADDRVDTYSGGMMRRANIAAGLLHEPMLLVLDEPTVGVDPQSRNQILAAVAELGGAGLSVLYTTHYMEEAERLCDRVGIIDGGRLIADGTRQELIARTGERTRIRLRTTSAAAIIGAVRAVKGVGEASTNADGIDVLVDDASATLRSIVAVAGDDVSGIEVDDADLEAVFLHLTGKALRD